MWATHWRLKGNVAYIFLEENVYRLEGFHPQHCSLVCWILLSCSCCPKHVHIVGWFTASLAFIYWMTVYSPPKKHSRHCLIARSGKGEWGRGAKLLWVEDHMAGDLHWVVKMKSELDTGETDDLMMEKANKTIRLTPRDSKIRNWERSSKDNN